MSTAFLLGIIRNFIIQRKGSWESCIKNKKVQWVFHVFLQMVQAGQGHQSKKVCGGEDHPNSTEFVDNDRGTSISGKLLQFSGVVVDFFVWTYSVALKEHNFLENLWLPVCCHLSLEDCPAYRDTMKQIRKGKIKRLVDMCEALAEHPLQNEPGGIHSPRHVACSFQQHQS